jgi:hypothetical protein
MSLRERESTSITPVKYFCKDNIFIICDGNHLYNTRIYSVVDSGFSAVQEKCQKVIAVKVER